MYNLKDRKVLVTGASRGLGAAIAKAFAEEGCDIAITYLGSKEKAETVATDIRSSAGRKVVVLQAVSTIVYDYGEYFADAASCRNCLSSPNAKELLKKQRKALEDLTLLFTTLWVSS